MQLRWRMVIVALVLALGLLSRAAPARAASPTEERTKLRSAESLVKKAGRLYTAKKYDEAKDSLVEAQNLLGELEKSDSANLAQPVANLRKSATKVRGLLKHEKVELPELPPAGLSAEAAAPGKGAKKPAAADLVSFTSQVAPILVNRCGKCHVQNAKGDFSMSSYEQLMQGSKNGIVVQPGSGKGSRIYEVIESGDMPRGGGEVPAEELTLLVRWIDEGAKFDGQNPGQAIDTLNRTVAMNNPPKSPPAKAGKGKASASEKPTEESMAASGADVPFARDIAPVLAEHCLECHGDRNPRAGLNLNSFTGLMRGGDGGAPVTAGNPSGSLLIQKLRGTATEGKQMPLRQPPLPEATIVKFENWIASGAKFDGTDENMPMARLAAVVKAMNSTHEELSRDRAALTEKNWHLVLPDSHNEHSETEHFLIYGNLSVPDLAEIGKQAEAQVPKLEKMLKIPTDQPFIKGRMTIYVFKKHYDYKELGTMLENRDIPASTHGHWHYDVVDAYAAIVPPKKDEYAFDALLAEQIAAVCVASQGTVPNWFADGSGRVVASKMNPKDSRVRAWENQLTSALADLKKPSDLTEGKLKLADHDALTYAFVKALMSKPGPYFSLLSALRGGASFDGAFTKAYGGLPSQAVANWTQTGGKRW